jgi:hypothetical protein
MVIVLFGTVKASDSVLVTARGTKMKAVVTNLPRIMATNRLKRGEEWNCRV